jgi:biotin-(acetyl-CoA carboxylase) ligase
MKLTKSKYRAEQDCDCPYLIDRIEAARGGGNARIGRKVVVFQSTASTNDIAWEYAANADNDGLCVLAESQSKGRGRRGRVWLSEPRQSILCSVLLTNTPIEAELLTLAAAVATAEAINRSAWATAEAVNRSAWASAFAEATVDRQSTLQNSKHNHGQAPDFAKATVDTQSTLQNSKHNHGQADPSAPLGTWLDRATWVQCRIKWPNDILIQEQKIAGILVEKRTKNKRPCFVIGIGINCNQGPEFFAAHDLNMPATSLSIQTGQTIDRTALVCELLEQIELWLDKSCTKNSVGTAHPTGNPVIERWLQLSGMLGRHITVECDGRRYSGFCRGVDPAQGLILHLDNSLVGMFSASHTSVVSEP